MIYKMACGEAVGEEIAAWKEQERESLYSSFRKADLEADILWKQSMENRIIVERFVNKIQKGTFYQDALQEFCESGMYEEQYHLLMQRAQKSGFSTKIRIYFAVSRFMKESGRRFDGHDYDYLEHLCFGEIERNIFENGKQNIVKLCNYHIVRDEVNVQLPVRVNWGGGWTDTPPYCNEKGGVVLNAAVKMNGICPIQVTVHRLYEPYVEFEMADEGVRCSVESTAQIQDCHNPYDAFALHKAALIACGIIPFEGQASLEDILSKIGGGIRLTTQVIGVPKGSGLGTRSILSGACVKAIYQFLGQRLSDNLLYSIVLCMEQIMGSGGGWQDQVGGVTPGIKFITTKPGMDQNISVEPVVLEPGVMQELEERFALIYTRQRRIGRNLLRNVVGNYIGGRKKSMDALEEMQKVAALMKFELERGNIDEFASLLNEHWKLSKQLDEGSTNTCIDQIFLSCEDLIDGKFIAGVGGGGFLQVILKKGVTREMLQKRLHGVFQDSGVMVWDTEFV